MKIGMLIVQLQIGLLHICAAYAQPDVVSNADSQIRKIDSHKYKTMHLASKKDLEIFSDSLLVGIISHKNKNDYSGKDVYEFKTGGFKKTVTYYFNGREELFAIDEQAVSLDTDKKKLRYYFASGRLFKVIDENGHDQIDRVDKNELYDRIIRLYRPDIIIK